MPFEGAQEGPPEMGEAGQSVAAVEVPKEEQEQNVKEWKEGGD